MAGQYKTHSDDQFAGQSGREPANWHKHVIRDPDKNIERNRNRKTELKQPDEIFIRKIADDTSKDKDWLNNRNPNGTLTKPVEDYKDTCCDKKGHKTSAFISLGLFIIAVAGGIWMVHLILLSPFTDNNLPRRCEQFPPMFGNNCEFRCHCSNSSEVCDENLGICQSGCIDGWHGSNCQIITSIFNESIIVADAPSTHLVQCTINKLWYNWNSVYLTVYNTTETTILINVSQSGEILASDKRLKATLSRATGTEADNVTFAFSIGKDDCDLAGMYRCQFDMVENLNTSYANLSISVRAPLSAVEISLVSSYVSGSNSSINCTVDIGDMTDTDVKLEGCQGGMYVDLEERGLAVRDTLNLNDDQGINCTNQIIYRYHLPFMDILNNSAVRCYSKDNLYNRSISTECASINVTQVQAAMEPTILYGEWGSKATFECKIPLSQNYFSTFQFYNDSTSPLLSITAENNFTIPPQNERISVVYTSAPLDNYRAVNITFDLRPGDDLCNLIGYYLCRVRTFNESLILPSDDEGQFVVAAPPSNVSIEIEPLYVIGAINETINCTAMINLNTTELSLQYNINGNYTAAPQNITQTIIESEMTEDCRHRVRVIYVFAPNHSLNGYKVVCVASDAVFGKESRSKEETLSILSIS